MNRPAKYIVAFVTLQQHRWDRGIGDVSRAKERLNKG
jgi:hypothetical protein